MDRQFSLRCKCILHPDTSARSSASDRRPSCPMLDCKVDALHNLSLVSICLLQKRGSSQPTIPPCISHSKMRHFLRGTRFITTWKWVKVDTITITITRKFISCSTLVAVYFFVFFFFFRAPSANVCTQRVLILFLIRDEKFHNVAGAHQKPKHNARTNWLHACIGKWYEMVSRVSNAILNKHDKQNANIIACTTDNTANKLHRIKYRTIFCQSDVKYGPMVLPAISINKCHTSHIKT